VLVELVIFLLAELVHQEQEHLSAVEVAEQVTQALVFLLALLLVLLLVFSITEDKAAQAVVVVVVLLHLELLAQAEMV
jgi:hypothetical protein